MLLGIIVVFFVGMSIASPYFLTFSNITNIIQYVSTYGIVSIGMLLVILTGGINLSVGGTLAISAYIGCSLMVKGYPWFVSVLVCILVGMLVGLVNGLAVTKLNIPPLIATLAVGQIGKQVCIWGLAQGAPLTGFSQTYLNIGASKLLEFADVSMVDLHFTICYFLRCIT